MRFSFSLVMLAAVTVRLLAASGDLWLDEISSVRAATTAAHWWNIFTNLPSDNNHHLISLWLRVAGAEERPIGYRSLSLIASVATIPMMYCSPLLRTLHERRIAALAAAASFPLIVYGSEARGYGVAVFATTIALHSAARFLDGRRPDFWRRVFAASAVGGLLAHATFLFVWIAVLAWTWSQRSRIPDGELVRFHRLPLLAAILYGAAVLRPMQVGGGDPAHPGQIAVELAVAAFGHVGVAVVLLLLLLRDAVRRLPLPSLILVAGVVLAPVAAAAHADYFHVRYFVVLLPWVLLSSARALGGLARHSAAGCTAAAVLAGVWLYGQAVQTRQLVRHGRGNAGELCRFLVESGRVRVASDHDFRARLVLEYYAPPGQLIFRNDGEEADWLVLQRERPLEHIAPAVRTGSGQSFLFARHFPSSSLSGLHWYVYRAAAGTNTTATASSYTTWNSAPRRN